MKKKRKLLGFDLDELINESLKSLFESEDADPLTNMREKEQQEKAKVSAERRKKAYSKDKGDVGDEGEEGAEITPEPVKVKKEKLPEINVEAVADKINSIRSGKSLKEDETMKSLRAYFEKLNGPERIALFAFLAGLDKVLGDLSTDVKTPHSEPFNIDMDKKEDEEKKRQPKGSKEPSANQSSETPIVVGENADKRPILNVIRKNRRL